MTAEDLYNNMPGKCKGGRKIVAYNANQPPLPFIFQGAEFKTFYAPF